jgi:hypothetical protein
MHIAAKVLLIVSGLIAVSSVAVVAAVRHAEANPDVEFFGKRKTSWASSAQNQQADVERFEPLPSEPQNWVFRSSAESFEIGTTYEHVVEVANWPGEEVSLMQMNGSTYRVVKWLNPDRSALVCTFQDGKLTGKHQIMLP